MVQQGVLCDPESLTHGAADLLVRSGIFAGLFPGHISAEKALVLATGLGPDPRHYVVVDIKFTTLRLKSPGSGQ